MMLLIALITFLSVLEGGESSWGYSPDNGPNTWSAQYPYCAGENQSPINIDTGEVWYSSNLHSFELENYDHIPPNTHWELVNTGQTLTMEVTGGDYRLREGGYQDDYRLVRLVWHWGSEDSWGAEHSIDDQGGPAELQLVHYNAKYKSYEEALQHRDGVVILAFLYAEGKDDNVAYFHIINKLANMQYPGDKTVLRPLPLLSLLPNNLNTYYRYHGSLTEPPCVEGVSWTIFTRRVELSKQQLDTLRSTLLESGRNSDKQTMSPPTRPLRPVNTRTIYSNCPEHATVFSSPLSSPISITLAVFFGFVVLLVFMRI